MRPRAGCAWCGADAGRAEVRSAFWPVIQMIRACIEDRDSGQLNALLGTGASEIAQLIPGLRLLLPSLKETKAISDPESARFRLFDSAATLLKNTARAAPLMIVIDDLHDADQPSLQMLRFIAREIKAARIVMLGTYRNAEVRQSPELGKLIGDLNREGRPVPIAGLSEAEVGQFVERELRPETGRQASGRFVSRDRWQSAVRRRRRATADRRTEAQVRRRAVGMRLRFPTECASRFCRGLAALSEETNAVLSIASVIGNEFDARLLERVSGSSAEQIVEQMEEATRIGTVDSARAGYACYQFSHALIREAIYEEIAAKQLMELHGAVGAALEEIHQGELGPYLAALAYHFRMAGIAEKAIDYSIESGRAARKVFAYEEVAPHWQAALELMQDLDCDPERKAHLLVGLGNIHYVTNPQDAKGIEFLEQALQIYESLGRQERVAQVHSQLGAVHSFRSPITDIPSAVQHYHKAEAILSEGPDRISLAAVYAGLAMVAQHLNRANEGLAWSRRAMEMAERIGHDEMRSSAATLQAVHLFSKGKLAEATSLIDKSYEEADRLNNVNAYSAAWTAGFFRNYLLDPREARGWFLRELAKPRVAQAPSRRRILLDQLAWSYLEEGDLAAASKTATSEMHNRGSALALYSCEWEQAESAERQALDEVRRTGASTKPKIICIC